MSEKPLGIPYGIWIIIFWFSFTSILRLMWIPILLQTNFETPIMINFFIDMVILSITLFIIYGLFKASGWTWSLLIAFIIIDIIVAFALSEINGVIIPSLKMIFGIIFIFYLSQSGVRKYFGFKNPINFRL